LHGYVYIARFTQLSVERANLLPLIKEIATYVKSLYKIKSYANQCKRARGSTREISAGLRTRVT